MEETVEKEEKSLVEPGTRLRRISLESFYVGNPLELVVHLEHLTIKFAAHRVTVLYRGLSPEFALNDIDDSWEIEMKFIAKWNENESEEVDLSLSGASPSVCFYTNKCKHNLVNLDLEFFSIKGLRIQPFRDYTVSNMYSDVIFLVEDKQFHLNKAFIASHSSFFEKLLFGDFKENNQKEIELKDASATAFTDMLDLLTHPLHRLYRKDSVIPVLQLAHRYDVPEVLKSIENMILLDSELSTFNKTELLLMAEKYGLNVVLMRVLSCWEHGDANRYMTDELWNELGSSLLLKLFKKFA